MERTVTCGTSPRRTFVRPPTESRLARGPRYNDRAVQEPELRLHRQAQVGVLRLDRVHPDRADLAGGHGWAAIRHRLHRGHARPGPLRASAVRRADPLEPIDDPFGRVGHPAVRTALARSGP